MNAVQAEKQMSILQRLVKRLHEHQTGMFVAELALVVAGVLIALAVDGWINDVKDRKAEILYLELLVRDIEEIRQQAELQIDYEAGQIALAAATYEHVNAPVPSDSYDDIRFAVATLIGRRTLTLHSATYDQMVSSGHLQLIRNHDLRDQVVRYIANMDRVVAVMDNNNRELVDDVFTPFAMRTGITAALPVSNASTGSSHNSSGLTDISTEVLRRTVDTQSRLPEDRVLRQPPDADSWNDIRRNLLFRMRIAAVGQALAESTLEESNAMAAAIRQELASRH